MKKGLEHSETALRGQNNKRKGDQNDQNLVSRGDGKGRGRGKGRQRRGMMMMMMSEVIEVGGTSLDHHGAAPMLRAGVLYDNPSC